MMRSTDASSFGQHTLPSSSHEGTYNSSGTSTNYQDNGPSFANYNPASGPQTGFSQVLDHIYGYEVLDDQMDYTTTNGTAQPNLGDNGLARRDVWSCFLDRLMTDPSPSV